MGEKKTAVMWLDILFRFNEKLAMETDSTGEKLPGRRIVEIDFMAEQMICDKCSSLLHLIDIIREHHYSLGSIFYMRCHLCKTVKSVASGKYHVTKGSQNSKKRFDVLTKTAAAMVNIGVGPSHVVNFFSLLNIPPPSQTVIKAAEREMGPAIETVAQKSCEKQSSGDMKEDLYKFDTGWQKRGSGRSYNSKSGHSALFNEKGGLVNYAVRITSCRTCSVAEKSSRPPPPHDCRKNWSGSAKAMEADMGAELVKKQIDRGKPVKAIVMDDDSTTYSKIQKEITPDIIEYSDLNHTTKNLTGLLYI